MKQHSKTRGLVPLCGLALLAAVAAGSTAEERQTEDPQTAAVAALHQLFDDEWERYLEDNPTAASTLGDRRYNDRWDDVALTAIEERHQADRAALSRLAAIDRSSLPPAERLNYDLFERQLEDRIEGHRFRGFFMALNQRGGVQTADQLHESLRFETLADFEDWLGRLRSVGAMVDQHIALLARGIEERRVQPRVVMERIPAQIAAQVVEDPEASPFYDPFRELPEELPEEQQQRLREEAKKAIAEVVVPAYRRFGEFFTGTYLPATRDNPGARELPDGLEYYAYLARHYTTTELTPDQIHELGVTEVARIRAEMEEIIRRVGFSGGFTDFLEHLRTDPKFYYQDPDELLEAYMVTSKRIDPELVRLFGTLPRTPYGVRPIPETFAPDTTTAYYNPPAADGSRPGYYYVNLYRPEVRPKYEIEVLTVHEAVPGHHLQIALAQELGELPSFRRFGSVTAFVEGWALYSEGLGEELGLYRDPYSKFGQLTYDMWRAVRLVVDTGIHAKGWSRQRAIDFFKANAAKTEHDIVNEIDRYIAWPGQALAYKIGQLEIQKLRRRAEAALGEEFDVRGFHDTVLGSGPVPLDVLADNVEGWIAQRRAAVAEEEDERAGR